MLMIDGFALVVVILTALYFCALGVVSLFMPAKATRFLLGFAGSPRAHYIELLARLLVGGSFVVHAPHMLAPTAFRLFGWILLVTTLGLLVLPWRWHHRFAQQAVPRAARFITLIGLCSLALGGLILAAAFRDGAA